MLVFDSGWHDRVALTSARTHSCNGRGHTAESIRSLALLVLALLLASPSCHSGARVPPLRVRSFRLRMRVRVRERIRHHRHLRSCWHCQALLRTPVRVSVLVALRLDASRHSSSNPSSSAPARPPTRSPVRAVQLAPCQRVRVRDGHLIGLTLTVDSGSPETFPAPLLLSSRSNPPPCRTLADDRSRTWGYR